MSELSPVVLDAFDLARERNWHTYDVADEQGFSTESHRWERSKAFYLNHNLHYHLAASILRLGAEAFDGLYQYQNGFIGDFLTDSLINIAAFGEARLAADRTIYLFGQWHNFPYDYDLDGLLDAFHYGSMQRADHTHPAYAVTGINTAVKHMVPVMNMMRDGAVYDIEISKRGFANSMLSRKWHPSFDRNGVLFDLMTIGSADGVFPLDMLLEPEDMPYKYRYHPGFVDVIVEPEPIVVIGNSASTQELMINMREYAHHVALQHRRMYGLGRPNMPDYSGHIAMCPAAFEIDGEIVGTTLANVLADAIPDERWRMPTWFQ